jgi:hypothetical protein
MFKIIENKLATEGIREFSYHELKDVDYQTVGITNDRITKSMIVVFLYVSL